MRGKKNTIIIHVIRMILDYMFLVDSRIIAIIFI